MKKLTLILAIIMLITSCKKEETKPTEPEPTPVVTPTVTPVPSATITLIANVCNSVTIAKAGSVFKIYKTYVDMDNFKEAYSYTTTLDGVIKDVIIPIKSDSYYITLTGEKCNSTLVRTDAFSVKIDKVGKYTYRLQL
jgi:hypothetical protein